MDRKKPDVTEFGFSTYIYLKLVMANKKIKKTVDQQKHGLHLAHLYLYISVLIEIKGKINDNSK